jgi:hypothetical protein
LLDKHFPFLETFYLILLLFPFVHLLFEIINFYK